MRRRFLLLCAILMMFVPFLEYIPSALLHDNSWVRTVYFEDESGKYIIELDENCKNILLDYLTGCLKYRTFDSREKEPSSYFLKNTNGSYLYVLIYSGEENIGIHINQDYYITIGERPEYYRLLDGNRIVEDIKALLLQQEKKKLR